MSADPKYDYLEAYDRLEQLRVEGAKAQQRVIALAAAVVQKHSGADQRIVLCGDRCLLIEAGAYDYAHPSTAIHVLKVSS